jgi:2,4-dichlorophenol 6-monooxygenase
LARAPADGGDVPAGQGPLVGDAARRFPPTGGLGLNTGVEDAENLLWKLGAVLRGRVSPALLDSYATECRPIALRNTNQSVTNHARMREVAPLGRSQRQLRPGATSVRIVSMTCAL